MSQEKVMEEVLTSFCDAIESEDKKRYGALANEVYDRLNKQFEGEKKNINNPEYFDLFINYRLKKILNLVLDKINEGSKVENKTKFIYLQYDFLKINIKQLIVDREGFSCSMDKTRTIIKMYLNYTITADIPEFTGEEKWDEPKFGTYEEWIKYCDSLYGLYYGHTTEYLKALETLLKAEIRKYKHIINKWYVKFKNGQTAFITNTWDDSKDEPVKWYLKGDYYKFNEGMLKDVDTSNYEQLNNGLVRSYEVPKEDIVDIFVIHEEMMV